MDSQGAKKNSKIKLSTILFYRNSGEQQKAALNATYDKDGNIKHLNIIALSSVPEQILQELKPQNSNNLPTGVNVGSIDFQVRGRTIDINIYHTSNNQSNEKLMTSLPSIVGLKAYMFIFSCKSAGCEEVQQQMSQFRKNNLKDAAFLITLPSNRNQQILKQLLELAIKYGIFYAQLPLLGDFKTVLQKIYLVKSVELGLEKAAFEKQLEMLRKGKDDLKFKIQSDQNRRETQMWELGQIWSKKVHQAYSLIGQMLKILKKLIEFLETKTQKYEKLQRRNALSRKINQLKLIVQSLYSSNSIPNENYESISTTQTTQQNSQSCLNNLRDQSYGIEDLNKVLQQLMEQKQKMLAINQQRKTDRENTRSLFKSNLDQLSKLVDRLTQIRNSFQQAENSPQTDQQSLIMNYQRSEAEKQEQKLLRNKILLQSAQIQKFFLSIKECQAIMSEQWKQNDNQDPYENNEMENPFQILIDYFLTKKLKEVECEKYQKRGSEDAYCSLHNSLQREEGQIVEQVNQKVKQIQSLLKSYENAANIEKLNSIENNKYRLVVTNHNLSILSRIKPPSVITPSN